MILVFNCIKLGNCCALVSNSVMYMAKRVLNIRLTHFQHLDNQSLGFIPDINRVLTKYALHHALDRYLSDGVFPCMHVKESFMKRLLVSNEVTLHFFMNVSKTILHALHLYCVLLPDTL